MARRRAEHRRETGDLGNLALGWVAAEGCFRVVAPVASQVSLVQRSHPESQASERVDAMQPLHYGSNVVWELAVAAPLRYYRYRVEQNGRQFDVADPRSTAVARQWQVGHPTWSVITEPDFDWQHTNRPGIPMTELVVLELHVRDFTVHPSAGVQHPGTYLGLVERGIAGTGLEAIRELGVNAVELLPVTSFPCLEPLAPWNPTGRNHWGYMPSFWMAPSERYSLAGQHPQPGEWIGVSADGSFADPGLELRQAVRELHAQGIAVVLDLVFNHVSIHDDNPLCLLDPGTWRVHNPNGSLRNKTGCGHDIDGRDPVMRQLIVDAAVHWLREYQVDGLRLDLAEVLDDMALAAIRDACKAEYGRALLIAEPWSLGGYRPEQLANLGWTVWNDKFRNGFLGHHPKTGRGFALGRADASVPREQLAPLIAGYARHLGGHSPSPQAAIHYVESHDDHTSADFVRLSLGLVEPGQLVTRAEMQHLPNALLRRLKLLAAVVLWSRGPVMLAQGQEWGRAKVQSADGEQAGPLDGNSYCRDDATNHLNWHERSANRPLVDWYRRAIEVRRDWLTEAFSGPYSLLSVTGDRMWSYGYTTASRRGQVAVLFNGEQEVDAWFELPGGPWWALVGASELRIVPTPNGVAVGLSACSAAVLWSG